MTAMRFPRSAVRLRRGPLIAGIVLGCLLVAGSVGWRVATSGGSIGKRFATGQSVVVPLDARKNTMVWARTDGPTTPDPSCTIGRRPAATPPAGFGTRVLVDDVRLDADGQTWRGALLLTAYPAGDYALTCAAGDVPRELAVGRPPRWYATDRTGSIAATAQIVLWAAAVLVVLAAARLVAAGVRRARSGRR